MKETMRVGHDANAEHVDAIDVDSVFVEIAGNTLQSTKPVSGTRGVRNVQNRDRSVREVGVVSTVIRACGIDLVNRHTSCSAFDLLSLCVSGMASRTHLYINRVLRKDAPMSTRFLVLPSLNASPSSSSRIALALVNLLKIQTPSVVIGMNIPRPALVLIVCRCKTAPTCPHLMLRVRREREQLYIP